jgi:hypothetical protein
MKIESIIILILVFSIVTISVGGIISDMNSHYDVNVSTTWSNKYNYANQINSSASAIQSDLDKAGTSTGYLAVLSGASAIWSGIKTTITLVLSVPGYTVAMIRGVAADLGLPPIVADVIIPIFIVMIIIVLIFAAIRLVRGDAV